MGDVFLCLRSHVHVVGVGHRTRPIHWPCGGALKAVTTSFVVSEVMDSCLLSIKQITDATMPYDKSLCFAVQGSTRVTQARFIPSPGDMSSLYVVAHIH